MTGRCDVSVIVPVFNAPEQCCDAVASVLATETLSTEVIVIDDGSEQPCLDALRNRFGEKVVITNDSVDTSAIIRYHAHENRGAYRTRLNAVAHCTGEFIKFLDQDDFLLPGVLFREVQLAHEAAVDVVQSNWQIRHYDAAGRELVDRRENTSAPRCTTIQSMIF